MWIFFLALPALLWADVMPPAAATPAPVAELDDSTAAQSTQPSSADPLIELRLRPQASAPVAARAPLSQLSGSSSEALVDGDTRWMSVEQAVTLTGYVDKSSINKNLEVAPGTVVWADEARSSQLTTIDNPAYARVLAVEKMGQVEVKEPRVLYYTLSAPVAAAPATPPATQPATPTDSRWQAQESQRRGQAVDISQGSLRSIEGLLKKGNPLLGRRMYLNDANGQRICRIDPRSPIDWLTLEQYVGRTAVFVGQLSDNEGELTLTVRSIRMR